jgi:hypothetical protein
MSVEERDGGEHTAVIVVRLGQADLGQDAEHVLFDRSLGDPEAPADAGIRASLGHQGEHFALAARQLLEGIVDVPCCNEFLNESGADDRPRHRLHDLRRRGVFKLGDTTLSK